ncbi:MAG: hypothetical protein M0P01_14700 [Treponema sp.]|nr:hypothetical protein [Treponema sp.]
MTKKSTSLLFTLIFLLAMLPSCSLYKVASVANDIEYSAKFDPTEIPKEYKEKFSSCRGFDFGRDFPGRDHRPFSVFYSYSKQRLTGKDSLEFKFDMGKKILTVYHRDMEHTKKEKKYIAAYKRQEEKFDRKYAGDIKKELDALTVRGSRNERPTLDYPDYLEGESLPKGLVPPASIFSYRFFQEYINAEDKSGDLRTFILSTSLHKSFAMRDLARSIGREAAATASFRLNALSPEYVLSYYLLKEYASAEERHHTTTELADYYSNVAFRGAAESLYRYNNLLSSSKRCKIANYIAARVYDLVMVIDNPEKLARIKKDYNEMLVDIHKGNLDRAGRYDSAILTREESIKRREKITVVISFDGMGNNKNSGALTRNESNIARLHNQLDADFSFDFSRNTKSGVTELDKVIDGKEGTQETFSCLLSSNNDEIQSAVEAAGFYKFYVDGVGSQENSESFTAKAEGEMHFCVIPRINEAVKIIDALKSRFPDREIEIVDLGGGFGAATAEEFLNAIREKYPEGSGVHLKASTRLDPVTAM